MIGSNRWAIKCENCGHIWWRYENDIPCGNFQRAMMRCPGCHSLSGEIDVEETIRKERTDKIEEE